MSIITGGPAMPPAAGCTRTFKDIAQAFEAERQGLPALRDSLAAQVGEAPASQALSRDIKLTLTAMVADLKSLPDTADAAAQVALNVAAAAANLGALDGAVTYVGRLLPLRVADDESQSPAARRITLAFENTGDEMLTGAERVMRADGPEAVRDMARVARSLAAHQLDDIAGQFEHMPDLSTYQRAVVDAMLTAYTAGILDACDCCVAP